MGEASDMINSLVEMYEHSVVRGRRADMVLAHAHELDRSDFMLDPTKNLWPVRGPSE